jgi:transposase
MEVTTVGIDLAKNVFAVVGMDANGQQVVRKQLRREQVLPFFRGLAPCLVGMEACGGSQWWARKIGALGHTVKLMNPRTVAGYRSGTKHDYNDAEAACEAVSRPRVQAVTPKSVAQQDWMALHRVRQALIKQRTSCSNQIRALLHERGVTVATGAAALRRQLAHLPEDNPDLSEMIRRLVLELGKYWDECDARIGKLNEQLKQHCDDERCQRLDEVVGIGPLIASAVVATIGNGAEFKRGRELSAFLGLVPGQRSSGGKTVLRGITKHGDRYLRTVLIHGARSALRSCATRSDALSRWMRQLRERQGANIAAVAVANKLARIVLALLKTGHSFDPKRAAATPQSGHSEAATKTSLAQSGILLRLALEGGH